MPIFEQNEFALQLNFFKRFMMRNTVVNTKTSSKRFMVKRFWIGSLLNWMLKVITMVNLFTNSNGNMKNGTTLKRWKKPNKNSMKSPKQNKNEQKNWFGNSFHIISVV